MSIRRITSITSIAKLQSVLELSLILMLPAKTAPKSLKLGDQQRLWLRKRDSNVDVQFCVNKIKEGDQVQDQKTLPLEDQERNLLQRREDQQQNRKVRPVRKRKEGHQVRPARHQPKGHQVRTAQVGPPQGHQIECGSEPVRRLLTLPTTREWIPFSSISTTIRNGSDSKQISLAKQIAPNYVGKFVTNYSETNTKFKKFKQKST